MVVACKFEVRTYEVEVDSVADQGEIVLWTVTEHSEPDAGSGDDDQEGGRLLGRRSQRDPVLIVFVVDCGPVEQECRHGSIELDDIHVELMINTPREVAWGDCFQHRPVLLNELAGLRYEAR